MKGKVLFVIHDVYQDDNEFPLGVAYLASVLRNKGVRVHVYCQDVFHYPNSHLAKFLQANIFDIIGLGFLAARFKETVLPLCKVINKHKKNAWFVLGGHGPSPVPVYMLQKTGADIVAVGEAEETIVEILDCKVNRKPLDNVKGIVFQQGCGIHFNERRKPIRDLNSLPLLAWDLFPMEKYTGSCLYMGQLETEKSLAIISGRGCYGCCSFCYRMEKGLRIRSVENVVEEMKVLNEKYGVSYFTFQDELFLCKKQRIFDFENVLDKNKLKIKFTCNARVDIFDRETAECLERFGCQKLNVGFESMNQKVLDVMNKHTTVEQNFQLVEICKDVGLPMGLNFIWGSPFDTEESLQGIVDFLKTYNTHVEIRTVRPPTPYPGSPLYYDAIKQGLLKGPEDFFAKFKNSDLLTINFTDIPDDSFYKLLYEANSELVVDHFGHTALDMDEAKRMIASFHALYFEGKHDFRGARHFER